MNIVFIHEKGNIAIMTLAEGADKGEAVEKFLGSQPNEKYVEYYVYTGKFPLNREFRDAWEHKEGKVEINENKAKDIHLNRIREERNKELEKLDKEQLRCLTMPDKLREIENKKQVLRDLPANFNGELGEWPEELSIFF